jgi:hypothetical protein
MMKVLKIALLYVLACSSAWRTFRSIQCDGRNDGEHFAGIFLPISRFELLKPNASSTLKLRLLR